MRVLGAGLYKQRFGLAWFGAVLSAMVGCKVKVLSLVRWWVLCASKGLVFGALLGAKQKYKQFANSKNY